MYRDVRPDNENEMTLKQVKDQIAWSYLQVDDMTKIQLKCWQYYAESRSRGGKMAMSFTNYKKYTSDITYLKLVKTRCVYCGDIGTLDEVISIITKYIMQSE